MMTDFLGGAYTAGVIALAIGALRLDLFARRRQWRYGILPATPLPPLQRWSPPTQRPTPDLS
jgi:hypothetical protein